MCILSRIKVRKNIARIIHRLLNSSNSAAVLTLVLDPELKATKPTRESCLERAIKSLNGPQVDGSRTRKVEKENILLSGVDLESLNTDNLQQNVEDRIKSFKAGETRTKNIVNNTIRYILVFKNLGNAAATFDPTKASRIVANGMFGILEVSKKPSYI